MDQREIKFRAWNKEKKAFIYSDWKYGELSFWDTVLNDFTKEFEPVQQFTGTRDKNKVEIYEGDTVRYRRPFRTTQTHTGDNIPNGSYTEPMEPGIETQENEVIFKDSSFCVIENADTIPLAWINEQYTEEGIKAAISCGRDWPWDEEEEGDLQYLLEAYKLSDLKALIDYISGLEVAGHVYQPDEIFTQ